MRLAHASAAAVTLALLIPTLAAQTPQDKDIKVAGGGITAPGWKGKVDAKSASQGMKITDSKFASEGNGFHITTGPAAFYWNEKNTAKGDFSAKATFAEPKQINDHPHPVGLFIGGSGLDTEQLNAIYCVAYRDGSFTIRQFKDGAVTQIVRKTPNEAVNKATGPDAAVTQEVAWTVKGGRAECSINGKVVGGVDSAPADGIVGIRATHNSDVTVTNFAIGK
jgi:hypothetical protein